MDEKRALRSYFEDVWNKGDMALVDRIISADHITHDPANPWVVRGPEGVRRLVSIYRNAFPQLEMKVEEQFLCGDKAITRWRATGTQAGKLFALPPTGKQVNYTGIQIDRFVGDQIAETWVQWDALGLVEQLGTPSPFDEEHSEEAELSYWRTHKGWWQASEEGTDEPHVPGSD